MLAIDRPSAMLRQESPSEWRRDAIDVLVAATLVVTITLIALLGG
jgi:hypothetical protein